MKIVLTHGPADGTVLEWTGGDTVQWSPMPVLLPRMLDPEPTCPKTEIILYRQSLVTPCVFVHQP